MVEWVLGGLWQKWRYPFISGDAKSAVSSEWIYELSWYYEINSDAIIFG